MKHFLQSFSISFLFLLSIGSQVTGGAVAPAQAMPSDYQAMSDNSGQAAAPSVHDMFKDVPQDELLQMIEEGQQFIKYLEENGTPEEKMAFSQAMEQTLHSFTEDDWKEFEAIVETVQDKLPPLVIEEPKQEEVKVIKEEPKKEVAKPIVVDNSLEKILRSIHKAINALLLKAKSDKVLAERITIGWSNKDNFNEMDRLLQTLNKKDHVIKLTTSKDKEIKSLLESIQNFNKRLQIENDQFVIADTFGLQADEETTATNLKKLNKIIEFFDNAIESLLPKLVKFIEEYEPEALLISKEHEDSAKKALEHATKVEKQQKRPAMNMQYYDKSSKRQKNQYQGGYTPGYQGGQAAPREIAPTHMEKAHRDNINNIPQLKKSEKNSDTNKNNDTKKKEQKKNQYKNAINNIDMYLEMNANKEVSDYMTTVNKAKNIYNAFGTPIDESLLTKVAKLREKRNDSIILTQEDESLLQIHEELVKKYEQNLAKNTQTAYSYYESLNESITNIAPQVDEMIEVIQEIKSMVSQMDSEELQKLNNSTSLKNFGQRIISYHAAFKNVQNELRNKHRLHKLKREHPSNYSSEERAYDNLDAKVDSLHGLDKKIADAKYQYDNLLKNIKTTTAKRKREEYKKDKNN